MKTRAYALSSNRLMGKDLREKKVVKFCKLWNICFILKLRFTNTTVVCHDPTLLFLHTTAATEIVHHDQYTSSGWPVWPRHSRRGSGRNGQRLRAGRGFLADHFILAQVGAAFLVGAAVGVFEAPRLQQMDKVYSSSQRCTLGWPAPKWRRPKRQSGSHTN